MKISSKIYKWFFVVGAVGIAEMLLSSWILKLYFPNVIIKLKPIFNKIDNDLWGFSLIWVVFLIGLITTFVLNKIFKLLK
jgi:hypothetical protein